MGCEGIGEFSSPRWVPPDLSGVWKAFDENSSFTTLPIKAERYPDPKVRRPFHRGSRGKGEPVWMPLGIRSGKRSPAGLATGRVPAPQSSQLGWITLGLGFPVNCFQRFDPVLFLEEDISWAASSIFQVQARTRQSRNDLA